MSPSTATHSSSGRYGERQNLLDLDWKAGAISYSFKAAPFGAFWAFSHGFWFATPAKTVFRNILVKGASFGTNLVTVNGKLLILTSRLILHDDTIGAFGAAYQGTAVLSAHIREKNDSINQAIGGFIAGGLAGLARTLDR